GWSWGCVAGLVLRRVAKGRGVAARRGWAECRGGVEPACPVWKTDAWAARPRAHRSAEGEGVEPSRLVARPGSGRVPSPVGLPFRVQSGWLDLNQRGPAPEAGG